MAKTNNKYEKAIKRGLDFLFSLQKDDGSFPADYGGSLFLTPMYVCLTYIMGIEHDEKTKAGIKKYLLNHQRKDGSFGLHIEGEGTVFVTTLGYCALRILGVKPEENSAKNALNWIKEKGGPLGCAPWGKFVLAVMNLYSWEGIDPILPELWLLPAFFPFHPSKMWCHARMVYLPMAWLYRKKVVAQGNPLIEQIREEIYDGKYNFIDWKSARKKIAPEDIYRPPSALLKLTFNVLSLYESLNIPFVKNVIKEKSLETILEHIRHEDESTNYINLGPVNKLLNTLVEWSIDSNSERFKRAASKLPLYLWEEKDGIRMNGYNSVQLWDTAFSFQSSVSTGMWCHYLENIKKMYQFIKQNQVKEDVKDREKHFRDISKGGWPFSNLPHGWPITDCTAEGLKSALLAHSLIMSDGKPVIEEKERIEEEMLKAAVELILKYQNEDGGWATYEKRRAGKWLEYFNPSAIFADIMVDYSYVECTSSCLQGLGMFLIHYPDWKKDEIIKAIERGKKFILKMQREDGSWEGSWGVCFTYATWFATVGLRSAGIPPWDELLAKAVRFLISRQNSDGGWGEHYSSCPQRKYISHRESQPAMTSWAIMALMASTGLFTPPSYLSTKIPAKHDLADETLVRESIKKGIDFLIKIQKENGDFDQSAIAGVFNKTCMITYDNYRRYFPLWALGLWKSSCSLES